MKCPLDELNLYRLLSYIIDNSYIYGDTNDFKYTNQYIKSHNLDNSILKWFKSKQIYSDTEAVDKLFVDSYNKEQYTEN